MATILITGANRGIGFAMARQAVARGDRVIATARQPESAGALAALAEETGRITVLALDVTDEDSVAALAEATADDVDLLVLNAGVLNGYGGVGDAAHDAGAWRDVLMTNVAGPFLVTRALLPHVERSEGRKIAIVSSIMGSTEGAKGNAYPYRASKAAAVNVARNLAVELKPRGIAVGAYHPGWVRTDMGGGGADIGVEESAEGLLARFDALSMATTGVFEDYKGEGIPF